VKAEVINRTIKAMCQEVEARDHASQDWRTLKEQDLLYEVTLCIIGSQMTFELAVASTDRLLECGLLGEQAASTPAAYRARITAALSEPLSFRGSDGSIRSARPRFRNRIATLLASTVTEIYGNTRTIRGLLCAADGARDAREALIAAVCGFGPKQASLFLRRVGFCRDLAVLDVHVLDYLRLVRGLTLTPKTVARLPSYEAVEETFREVAGEFGHGVGCVDLAMWLTMRVVKREAYI
jgi:N-glycosylase/DNA lyase